MPETARTPATPPFTLLDTPALVGLFDRGLDLPRAVGLVSLVVLCMALWVTLRRIASAYGKLLEHGESVDKTTLFRACHDALRWETSPQHYPYPGLACCLIALTLVAALATDLQLTFDTSSTCSTSFWQTQPPATWARCLGDAIFSMRRLPNTPWMLALILFFAAGQLILAALIDAHTGYLPDALTLPLLWLGLILAWSAPLAPTLPTLDDALAGALLGYGLPWLVTETYRLWRGVHGLGGGDLKMMAALGAWLGWQALPGMLLLACCSTLIWTFWHTHALKPSKAAPFGPALAGAGLLTYSIKPFLAY